MLEVLHLSSGGSHARGASPLEELATWPSDTPTTGCSVRLARVLVEGGLRLSTFPEHDRVLTLVEGAALVIDHGGDAASTPLRPLEPYRSPGVWSTTLAPTGGAALALEVLVRPGVFRVEVEPVRLGRRRLRETLGSGQAFVLALVSPVLVRVSDEEEPFPLDEDEVLWLRDVGGQELDIAGEAEDSTVLLVRIETHQGTSANPGAHLAPQ